MTPHNLKNLTLNVLVNFPSLSTFTVRWNTDRMSKNMHTGLETHEEEEVWR